MKKRYGGWENIKDTIESDPVGIASDIAGALTGGGALAGKYGVKAANIGAMVDPVNMAANAAKIPFKGLSSELANEMMRSSMKFSTVMPGKKRQRLAETMLENEIIPNDKGIEKAGNLIEKLTKQQKDIIKGMDVATPKVGLGKVDTAFNNAMERAGRLANESAPADVAPLMSLPTDSTEFAI